MFSNNFHKGKKLKVNDTLEALKDTNLLFDDDNKNFWDKERSYQHQEQLSTSKKLRKEFALFNYQTHYEQVLIKKEIEKLIEQIKEEIERIKKANVSLLQEASDASKISVEQLPEKPGIYHVRFFEAILKILATLRLKIGESKTWLEALISRKKKRGSLFVTRSKKMGTQYSLSQELSSARSVQ